MSIPAEDDFRAHPDYGVTNEPYEPPAAVIEAARDVLETACEVLGRDPDRLTHARVDGIERDGRFLLMELELIEPYLGVVRRDVVDRFADAVEQALARGHDGSRGG